MNNQQKEVLHLYIRVSGEKSVVQDNSLPAQREAGIRRAIQLGLDYVVHEEPGRSASEETIENRPTLKALLQLCTEKKVKHIFVTELDRLTRHPVSQFFIKQVLIENDVMLYTIQSTINLQDVDQALMADLGALLSRREMSVKNARVKRSLHESVKKGKVGGGVMLPYGFKKDANKMLLTDPEESEVIKRIFTMSLQSIGSPTIAEVLNKEGIPTRGRKALRKGLRVKNKYTGVETHKTEHDLIWKPGTIIGILKNTIYKGDRRYLGEVISVEPIISPEMWDMVQTNLTNNRAYSGGTQKHFYLLKGLLRCKKCQRNLYGYTKENRGQFVYMCSSKREHFCGMKSVNIARLDNLVWEAASGLKIHIKAVLEELTNNNLRASNLIANEQKLSQVEGQLEQLQTRKTTLLNLYLSNRIELAMFDKSNLEIQQSEQALLKTKYELHGELRALQAPVNILQAGIELERMFFEKASMDNERKRKTLLSLVKNIEIDYDDSTAKHTVVIELTVDRPAIVRQMEGRMSKKFQVPPDPKFLHGDYKTVDDMYTDGKIWEGSARSVYETLFPPVVKESHRSLYNHRGYSEGVSAAGTDGLANRSPIYVALIHLTYEMKNITGAYHFKSTHKLLSRKILEVP